jgi:hypothetical protein
MNNILILILFLTGISSINAQNLIPDPGFEEVEFVFDGKDTVFQFLYWSSLLSFKKFSSKGFPSYSKYLSQANNSESNYFYSPYEGDALFMPTYNWHRNLFQTKLTEPLQVGKKYRISFKYMIMAAYYSKNKIEKSVNGKIGIHLSINDLNNETQIAKYVDQSNPFKPMFGINNYNADNNFLWLDFEYIFEAESPFRFITIGNFTRLLDPIELAPGPVVKGVTFKIDNVNLTKVEDDVPLSPLFSEKINIETNPQLFKFSTKSSFGGFVKLYNQHVSKAEDFIILNNIDSTLFYYKEAFKQKSPDFKDYRNANKVLALSKSDSHEETGNIFEYTSKSNLDKLAANQIDSLFKLDQKARHNNIGIAAQDSANYLFLNALFYSKTISEQTIGINGMRNLEVILLHLSRYAFFEELIPVLIKQVEKGNFDNRQFASLVDSYYSNVISGDIFETYYYTTSAYPIFTQFVIPELDPDSIKVINERRSLIGLESLESQYQKQFYNFKYGYRDYEFYQFFTFFPAEEFCTEEEKMLYLEKEKEMVEELKQKYQNLIIWSK